MNTESTEHISSLMDGEVSQETGRFLVRRLGADGKLRQTWARYHLIRDCLRYQDGQLVRNDLSSRVQQALSTESLVPAKFRFGKTGWLKPVAGLAIAASVALIAILTVSQTVPPVSTALQNELTQTEKFKSFVSPNMSRMTPASQTVSLSGNSGLGNQRMNAYLLRHYQVSEEAGGGRGFVSFVPIVVTRIAPSSGSGYENENENKETKPDLR